MLFKNLQKSAFIEDSQKIETFIEDWYLLSTYIVSG